jgi:hypothetical protein
VIPVKSQYPSFYLPEQWSLVVFGLILTFEKVAGAEWLAVGPRKLFLNYEMATTNRKWSHSEGVVTALTCTAVCYAYWFLQ